MGANLNFSTRLTVCIAAVMAAVIPATLSLAAPTPSLTDAVARLEYGATSGSSFMLLQIDGLDAQDKQNLALLQNVRDLGRPNPPDVMVNVRAEERQPAGATSRTWLLLMGIKDLPANTSQKR